MTNQSANTAARPSDAAPDCPDCGADVFVERSKNGAAFVCRACDELFTTPTHPAAREGGGPDT